MRPIRITLIGAFACGALAHAARALQPGSSAGDIAGWLDARQSEPGDLPADAGAARLVFTVTIAAADSRESIERRWREIAPFPEHPERPRIERLRNLSARPETLRVTFLRLDPTHWRADEEAESGSIVTFAGNGDVRWMSLTKGSVRSLTLTKRGVPYPPGFNVGQLLNVVAARADLLTRWGLGSSFRGAARITRTGGTWTAEIGDPVGAGGWTLTGTRTGDSFRIDRAEGHGTTWAFSAPHTTPSDSLACTRVTIDRGDGLVETIELVEFSTLPSDAAREACTPPSLDSLPSDANTLDFRERGSAAWARYEGGPTITWQASEGGDTYETSNATAVPSHGAASQTDRVSRWSLAAAIGLTALAGACAVWICRKNPLAKEPNP